MDHFADSFSEEQYCHSIFMSRTESYSKNTKWSCMGLTLKGLKLSCDVELPHQIDGSSTVL